jgi:pimeloyl-ACP methyl ester carboxylesterase
MHCTAEHTEKDVTERDFELEVAGDRVPGVLWAPADATGPRPLVLMGHGGTQHKRVDTHVARARHYVRALGFAVAAIDAPQHGDRVTPEEAAEFAKRIRERVVQGSEMGAEVARLMVERARKAVAEWQATLDALQEMDIIGKDGPVGYWGVSMGTAFGVPFVAAEPRITAAVFGLAGLNPDSTAMAEAAHQITIPVEFVVQWDDELASREGSVALFDAFGSTEKSMHVNPGGHLGIPAHERDSWERFFTRHLVGRGATQPVGASSIQ